MILFRLFCLTEKDREVFAVAGLIHLENLKFGLHFMVNVEIGFVFNLIFLVDRDMERYLMWTKDEYLSPNLVILSESGALIIIIINENVLILIGCHICKPL